MINPIHKISPDESTPLLLFRYLQTANPPIGKYLRLSFIDETRKITVAKYKLVKILESNLNDLSNWVYRLDARSIRYMKRCSIIENKPFKGAK